MATAGLWGWAERPDRRAGRGREAEPPRPIGHRPPPLARPPPAGAAALRSWQQPSEPAAGSQRRAAQRPQTEALPLCTGVSRRCTGVSVVPAVGPVRSVPSPPALSTRTPRWSPAGGPPCSSHPHEVTETAAVTRFLPTTTQPGVRIGGGRPVQPARGAVAQEPEQQRQHSGPATLPLRDDRPARRCPREFGQSAVDATKSSVTGVTGRLRGRILCTNVQGCCVGV